jgi:hypothetical protein
MREHALALSLVLVVTGSALPHAQARELQQPPTSPKPDPAPVPGAPAPVQPAPSRPADPRPQKPPKTRKDLPTPPRTAPDGGTDHRPT